MNTEVRRKLDMAARVREFTRAHAATEQGYAPVLTRLEELLARAEGIGARQHQGRVAAKGARARRKELRRMLHAPPSSPPSRRSWPRGKVSATCW